MKAALILPWYGKLPWYWPLFEKSAQRMCFDVIVVAEHGFTTHGQNFRVAEMSLDELRARAESALGCEVCLDSGYKVCDLRPMFGIVFADLLSDYDYWAYGDCDVIYGMGMNDFVRKAMLGGWDVATAWKDWLCGPFTLMRNTDSVNNLFRRSSAWRTVLGTPGNQMSDELGPDWFLSYCILHMSLEEIVRRRDWTFGSIVWRAKDVRLLSEYVVCDDTLRHGGLHVHSDGRLTLHGNEAKMFHFISAKKHPSFIGGFHDSHVPDEYELTKDGVLPMRGALRRGVTKFWHRIWGWSAYLWRVATLDAGEMKRLRRFVRRKAGVKEWWLEKSSPKTDACIEKDFVL